jgi:hypothetical protein
MYWMMNRKIHFLDQSTENFFKLVFGFIDEKCFTKVDLSNAEYLFYSPFTPEHHIASPEKIKIMISGENICPDFNACDYAISSDYMEYGDRYLRVPYYAFHEDAKALASRKVLNLDEILKKTEFCNFIYSNINFSHSIRNEFFLKLSSTLPVLSPGRALQNDSSFDMADPKINLRNQKMNLIEKFRFTIAMENSEQPGYITEKLTDALIARTIPIYWGDPRVGEEFNSAAFLNLRNFQSHEAAIREIISIDSNSEKVLSILNAPVFKDGVDRVEIYLSRARNFLESIFEQPLVKARRRPRHGYTQWLEQRRRKDQTGFRRLFKRNHF